LEQLGIHVVGSIKVVSGFYHNLGGGGLFQRAFPGKSPAEASVDVAAVASD
jgi:hypothetical protein